MSRPKITEYDRMVQYMTRADLAGLREVQRLLEFAILMHDPDPVPVPPKTRTRKTKAVAKAQAGTSAPQGE